MEFNVALAGHGASVCVGGWVVHAAQRDDRKGLGRCCPPFLVYLAQSKAVVVFHLCRVRTRLWLISGASTLGVVVRARSRCMQRGTCVIYVTASMQRGTCVLYVC